MYVNDNAVFYNTIGENYVAIALRAARRADPHAKLYINDYHTDGAGAKSSAMYNLVSKLKRQGVPIDGIGIQGHLIAGSVPSTLQANWARFARFSPLYSRWVPPSLLLNG